VIQLQKSQIFGTGTGEDPVLIPSGTDSDISESNTEDVNSSGVVQSKRNRKPTLKSKEFTAEVKAKTLRKQQRQERKKSGKVNQAETAYV
jgi:hypothetical protein